MTLKPLFNSFLLLSFVLIGNLSGANCESGSQLIVIRHGQSDHNLSSTYNSNPAHAGYVPSHLTEEGKKEALTVAQELLKKGFNNSDIAAVYVSPMPRTQETALELVKACLFDKSKIKIDLRLTEFQAGDLEGKTYIYPWDESYAAQYHTETRAQINERVGSFYEAILSDPPCGAVIVVTHRGIAQSLLQIVTQERKVLETGQAVVVPLAQPARL